MAGRVSQGTKMQNRPEQQYVRGTGPFRDYLSLRDRQIDPRVIQARRDRADAERHRKEAKRRWAWNRGECGHNPVHDLNALRA